MALTYPLHHHTLLPLLVPPPLHPPSSHTPSHTHHTSIRYVFTLNVVNFVVVGVMLGAGTESGSAAGGGATGATATTTVMGGAAVTAGVGDLGAMNTFVSLYLLFVVDDLIYAPAHWLMHRAWLYGYIHKHHHRQNVPIRGYADAGNEHPLEQVVGLSIVWATLQIVSRLCGVHALTMVVHFVAYAALALLNHTNMDVRFKVRCVSGSRGGEASPVLSCMCFGGGAGVAERAVEQ